MRITINRHRTRSVLVGLTLAAIVTGGAAATATAAPTAGPSSPGTAAPAPPSTGGQEIAPAQASTAGQLMGVAGSDQPTSCRSYVSNAMCFFWDKSLFGNDSAAALFKFTVWDHMVYRFPGPGRGTNQRIGNNAGSFWNFGDPVTVYYNPSRNGERPSGPNQYYAWNQQRYCWDAGPYICNNNRAHFRN